MLLPILHFFFAFKYNIKKNNSITSCFFNTIKVINNMLCNCEYGGKK